MKNTISFQTKTAIPPISSVEIESRGSLFPNGIPVERLGMTQDEALHLRAQLGSIVEDWDDPEMDVYNDILDHLFPR